MAISVEGELPEEWHLFTLVTAKPPRQRGLTTLTFHMFSYLLLEEKRRKMRINPPHKKRRPPPESGTEVARNPCCRPPGPASAPHNVRVKDYSTALSQALIRQDLFNPWASLDVSGQQLFLYGRLA
jgi:hypothetical protein